MCVVLMGVTFVSIVCFPKDVFRTGHQSLIQDKFRILCEINEPKIIMVSGSSSSYGLDQKMLEEASGYRVANLGLHAGMNELFYSELSKQNINPGDIVLLGYEYGWYKKDAFTSLGTDLVMSGIDHHIEMYQYIPLEQWPSLIGNIFNYAVKKNTFEPRTGIYSREAFDSETGQMTMERDYEMVYTEDMGTCDVENAVISEESIQYLKEYKAYVEKCGASVYFVAPPVVENGVLCDYQYFYELVRQEEEKIGIPYISDPVKYIYPTSLMSNAKYHCNSKGEKVRTEMLIEDLKNAGVF